MANAHIHKNKSKSRMEHVKIQVLKFLKDSARFPASIVGIPLVEAWPYVASWTWAKRECARTKERTSRPISRNTRKSSWRLKILTMLLVSFWCVSLFIGLCSGVVFPLAGVIDDSLRLRIHTNCRVWCCVNFPSKLPKTSLNFQSLRAHGSMLVESMLKYSPNHQTICQQKPAIWPPPSTPATEKNG